jgi:predicted nucleotidyltransferase
MLKDIQQSLIKELQSDTNVEFAYLFGSFADGSFNDRSDVDLALYLKKVDFDTQLKISFELSKVLKKDVDLVVLNKAKNLYLLDDIIQKGIVIKDSDKRVDFELRKHHQFLDFVEFKKRIYVA